MIDFVITWVDGADSDFISLKNSYASDVEMDNIEANGDCRYRSSSDMLRYWFRSIEQFAPWVRRVYFVTCGQKPTWLDSSNPKLYLVDHRDFIPEKYLPTFNARTIELNIHRIKGLAERFVLFNDDMFLLRPVSPDFFFKEGNPVLVTDLRYPRNLNYANWCRVMFNDFCIVNKHFDVRKSIWEHRSKWFSIKELGLKRARQNLTSFLVNKSLPVGNYAHLALPHLKSTFEEIWDIKKEIMDTTCKRKFRSDDQVNQWLCCGWNQAKGAFYSAHEDSLGIRVVISPKTIERACELIRNQSVPQICANDTSLNLDYSTSNERLLSAFASILPRKSSFEKY